MVYRKHDCFGSIWVRIVTGYPDFMKPYVDVVIRGVREHGYVSYGKRLGVRDNAIRKHLLRNGIDPKTLNVVE